MHNLRPQDAEIESLFLSKASRIAESAVREQQRLTPAASHPLAKRRYDREDLLRIGHELKSQIQHGNDTLLKAYGFSILGIAYFIETRLGEAPERAKLLAHALESLWQVRADA